jgi:aspartyl aminopeptidase
MHSCFETAGCADVGYMVDALTAFYSTSLSAENGNYTLL